MPNSDDIPRLPKPKQTPHVRSVQTGLVVLLAVCLVCFVYIPLALGGTEGVNAIFISADNRDAAPTPTPENFALDILLTDVTPSPTPTNEIHIYQYALLQEGDNYPAVEALQIQLMKLGYLDSDEPSTFFGPATATAVSLVQRTMSVEINGIATSDLQEYLYSGEATPYEIKLGDHGPDVKGMQSRLHELGYYEAKVNGYFGVATESALAEFEAKNKRVVDNQLLVDGVLSVTDRDLLYSPSAAPKIDPTPTPSPTPKKTPAPTPKPPKKTSSPPKTGSPSKTDSSSSVTPAGNSSGDTPVAGSYNASYSVEGLISVATAMKGIKYSRAEESPQKGFDCSGLVYFCLRTCGVSTSRYSAAGFAEVSRWPLITAISDLQRGDLVFFRNDTSSKISHTGIYMGGGSFIHSSSSAGGVIVSSISTAYWTRNFVSGRRVF